MLYERLINEANLHAIEVYERRMSPSTKGLYSDNIIWINKSIKSRIEKRCILAEELGHHFTTTGDISNQSTIPNRKQELRAREWAYRKLVPLSKIICAHRQRIANRYELSDFLNVTEEFLEDALNWYKSKYGLSVSIGEFTICFDPLGVVEFFD